MTAVTHTCILTIACPDAVGIVAAVSGLLAGRGGNIVESTQYSDLETGRFFMRIVVDTPEPLAPLREAFAPLGQRFGMDWGLHDARERRRVMLLVSRADHCLHDLLYRHRTGVLAMDISAVVSNHPDLEALVRWHDIPWHHLPVTPDTRAEQEAAILAMVEQTATDLVVLARYMQILSDGFCRRLSGRLINIHHSFLPSFKGAQPYRQAHDRGVKLIGATAHYVTPELDEGPIIEQEVERVDHTFTAEQLVAVGRDIENIVLARALRYHLERRVFLNGHRTVVLR